MTGSQPYAEPKAYDELIDAMAKRAGLLGISYAALDDLAGVPAGFTGRAFGPGGSKRIGWLTSFPMMQGLGLRLQLVADDELAKRYASRVSPRRPSKQGRPTSLRSAASAHSNGHCGTWP